MKAAIEKLNVLQNNYGISIEYTLDPDEQINAFANGMIMNNNITGILGYIFESSGGTKKLRFNHPDGMPLSLMLTQTLKKRVILGILSCIADIVCRAEEYMLDENGFVFDPQVIFVNITAHSADMVYLPTGLQGGCNFSAFVKLIIGSSIISTDEDCSYVQKLVNHINSTPHISSKALGEFIKALMEETSGMPAANPAPNPQIAPSVPVQPQSAPPSGTSSEIRPQYNPQAGGQKPKSGGLFSGFGGKKKSEKAEKPAKPVKPGKAAKTESNSGFGFNIPGQSPVLPPNQVAPNNPPAPAAPTAANVKPPVYAAVPETVAHPMTELRDEFQDGKTVLLDALKPGEKRSRQVYLEGKNGEKIFINKNMFFIGKADKGDIPNDYIIRNSAVSRNHAYLQLTEGGASITDNNSSNGTFVNGQRIPALAVVELKNGDVVRLANEEYVFKVV